MNTFTKTFLVVFAAAFLLAGCTGPVDDSQPPADNTGSQPAAGDNSEGQDRTGSDDPAEIEGQTGVSDDEQSDEPESDTSDWRVYNKEDKNLEIAYHPDWYFQRDTVEERQNNYDFFVGFAETDEIFDTNEYDVVFVIKPIAEELGYEYQRAAFEEDGNDYVFATDNEDYVDVIATMAEKLKYKDN